MSATVAITGATGFAGQHAVAALLSRGSRLRALVRDPARAALPASVEVIGGSLADPAALQRLVNGADAVVHLAAALTALNREGYFEVNARGTAALTDAARKAGVRRFVHVSSLAARQPQLSAYAASKRQAEDTVAAQMAELNAVIVRPPAVYGPGDRATLPLIRELTRPVAAIPGLPRARFSLLYGRDLARLLVKALDDGLRGIHELSDGKPGGYCWNDMIAAASSFRGAPVRPLFLPRALPAAVAAGAEARARRSGKPGMGTRGKIAARYHADWVSRGGSLAR
ncbi:MAG: NAD-dependent epimerase/dehydratase family protein, partial [Aestuariivirga sp.]|uniref:NAD-dependent epimerase/dehydratase family protein n=1 Tax=Aestuariivirga sp. TaxID=2650926 RepID=UPI0038D23D2B